MSPRVEDFLSDQVARRPAAFAMSDGTGAQWRWQDLSVASDAAAACLAERGVVAGDRVVILCENSAAAVAFLFGCWRTGAVAVPVNARQSAAELARIFDHAAPRAVVFTTAVSPDATAHAARHDTVSLTGAFGTVQIATPHASNPEEDPCLAVLLYTTGTTGMPKGVMLSHANLRFGGMASARLRGMTARDLIYGVLPISHVFGLASIVTAAAYTGAAIRFEARFSASKLHAALGQGITLLSAVPQMHALLMQYTAAQGHERLGSDNLRYVSSGAAPLDPTWKRKAEAFYGVALQNGYGMTETTAGVTITDNPLGSEDISAGPPLPGVELRIDQSVPGGGDGLGEVLTRGGHVMLGYFRNLEETARVLDAQGWMHTGDLGKIDEAGNLHILGRSKELIIHGGFNVYPPEVEAAINDHPQVIQSAVIGKMTAGDEEVLAFVQVAPACDLSPDSLRDFLKDRLAGYKRPSAIVLATELPAAPTGKILKHRLLTHFADQLRERAGS
ncbi:class I adenylate-forming enzyme family protein [uncultured Roseobacter sp.]|uniref:class I adenylate-forming enzyme family protein n=1 Tax=uncultured Roseobacter sp. TaxID=114847 RepID=UPI0026081862|nr:class I adenylate-forming enzyme family protein [uncultured Roseobacter sp.]